jgi:hypothetical protein
MTIETHKGSILNDGITIHGSDVGAGGAFTQYTLNYFNKVTGQFPQCSLKFQVGNPAEGINGLSNEALLAVLISRMEGFQSGQFACMQNETALNCCKTAMEFLKARTSERCNRGVEGTQTV